MEIPFAFHFILKISQKCSEFFEGHKGSLQVCFLIIESVLHLRFGGGIYYILYHGLLTNAMGVITQRGS